MHPSRPDLLTAHPVEQILNVRSTADGSKDGFIPVAVAQLVLSVAARGAVGPGESYYALCASNLQS